MLKKLTGFVLFIFSAIILSSCAQLLKTTRTNKNPNQQNKGNQTNAGNSNTQYNKQNFTGNLINNIVYTANTNASGKKQQLAMDIYVPPNAEGKKFPLVLLIHGGGFKNGDKSQMSAECFGLAENGYVAVSINYRLGWGTNTQKNGGCNTDTLLLKQAIYRAVQDAHTALNYAVEHSAEYSIDKNWVFIGGNSAGAIAALFTAYFSPKNSGDFFDGFTNNLGQLNKVESNSSYTLRGVLSMWGAFLNPGFLNRSNALPTLFFQGAKDPVVPFNVGHLTTCPSSTLAYGTYPLYNRLKDLGETTVAHVDPNGGHGVFSVNFRLQNTLCFLNDVRQGIKKQVYLTGEQNSCDK